MLYRSGLFGERGRETDAPSGINSVQTEQQTADGTGIRYRDGVCVAESADTVSISSPSTPGRQECG